MVKQRRREKESGKRANLLTKNVELSALSKGWKKWKQ